MTGSGKSPGKIGEILIECGMITPIELEEALGVARRDHLRLGEALIRLGTLGRDQLAWALGIQFDLSHVELRQSQIDWDFLLSLPLERLQGLMTLPYMHRDGQVHIVIADPTVEGLKEVIETMFPSENVIVQLATATEIDEVFEEAVRRRHRVDRRGVMTPWPPEFGLALMRWIPRLESGRIDRVVVTPGEGDDYEVRVITPTAESREPVASGEMRATLLKTREIFACESPAPFVTFGIRLAPHGTSERPVRTLLLQGAHGHLLTFIGISPALSAPRSGGRITAVTVEFPATKTALLQASVRELSARKATSRPLILSLEAHLDAIVEPAFQVEIAPGDVRLRAFRDVVASVRPDVLLLEVESVDELRRVAIEAATQPGTRVFAVVRAAVDGTKPGITIPGVDWVALSGDGDAVERRVTGLFSGAKG